MISCSNGGCCGVFKLWHEEHDGKGKQVKLLILGLSSIILQKTIEQPLMNDSEKHEGCSLLHFMKPNTI
jgi:hypothetical protein